LKVAEQERSLADLNASFTEVLLATNRLLNVLDETTDEKEKERLKTEISKLEAQYNRTCTQYNEQISKLSELPIDLPNSCMILK